jgi:creatinine amidohydrolase
VEIAQNFQWLRATGPLSFAWMAQDLHESGAMGDAGKASADKGDRLADYSATAFIELLQDVEAFDLSRLVDDV